MTGSRINELYKVANGGDKRAEEQLFERLSARFRLFVRQRIGDVLDADEVVQDALEVIYREYSSLRVTTSFAAWAYKVLDNRILSHLQTGKRRANWIDTSVNDDEISTSGNFEPGLKRRLLHCLRKIGAANGRYSRILNLHYQGFDTEEICKRMNLSQSNFYSILSRARSMLRVCLGEGDTK